jgi:chaperonin GroES
MTTTVSPTSDRLLVRKIDDDKKTKSGLVLSDDVVERPTKGKVLDIGEGRMNEDGVILPMKIKKDDIILYPKYAGHSVKIDSEELLILDEKEVLAVLKEGF